MGTKQFSQLSARTLPLIGTEVFAAQQGGNDVQLNLNDILGSSQFIRPSGDTTGVTDRTNIQAALTAALGVSTGVGRSIILQSGIYYIDQTIVGVYTLNGTNDFASRNYLTITGLGLVQINQVTTNQGHFEFRCPVNSQAEQLFVTGIWFHWNTQQTISNTAAVALGFRSVATTATNETIFQIYVDGCMFSFGYRVISNTTPAGQFPIWGLELSRFHTYSMSGSVISNQSPVSVGCPNISARMGLVAAPYLGGGEAIFNISACDNALFDNVECLQVVNVPLYQIDASNFTIIACKGEQCSYANKNAGALFVYGVIIATSSSGNILGFRLNGLHMTAGVGHPAAFLSAPVNTISGNRQIAISGLILNIQSGTGTLVISNNLASVEVNFLAAPDIQSLGTGPAVVSLTDSANTVAGGSVTLTQAPGGAITSIGDADHTWNGRTSPNVLVYNTPLTVNRAVTLTTGTGGLVDNFWDGLVVRVVRTANATGAFTLTVNGGIPASKTIAIGTWGDFTWDYTLGWVQTASGTL